MLRRLKCYTAYTTLSYRIFGVVLIPCIFWLGYGALLYYKCGRETAGTEMYTLYFMLSVYVVLYEIFTDYWVLGGCLSDAARELRYFRTSCGGVEVVRNIVMMDLIRRFLYCMIFGLTIFLFTGWTEALIMGLAIYCVAVGILNVSRHFDGFQRNTGIALLAQAGMALVNALNFVLIELAGDIMLLCLAVLYCGLALGVSMIMVRRITIRVGGQRD